MGVATIILVFATLLFLDFTGTIHGWLGWVAKIQFIPALLGLHMGVVLLFVILTLIFGRLYCSVICPLGIYQDVMSRFASLRKKKRKFSYSAPLTWLRWSMVAIFIVAFVAGIGSVVAILDPYSSFGLMVNNIFAPLYKLGNNLLAYFAERVDSYAFYNVDIIIFNLGSLILAIVTMLAIGYLAWRNGRTYCNTICPLGTVLGLLSRFSIFKIVIDTDKCNGCKKCVRECKAACIDGDKHKIDYSRCVACFDCIDSCNQGAISYTKRRKAETPKNDTEIDANRRKMLAISATIATTAALKAEEKLVDGGLATIEDKEIPKRNTPIVPAGACSIRNFSEKCTGCQLCVTVCPNNVLRPATGLKNFLQPEMSYEYGYCRPECNKCSEVCPAGAIERVSVEDKSSIQIGHAVWVEKNCVVLTDGVDCGNCARHCPVGAISMVQATDTERYGNRKIPVVDIERCIGCGACEYNCPSRPFSAIYVEGNSMHRNN